MISLPEDRSQPAAPGYAARPIAGYSETPLWKELGIRSGDHVTLLNASPNWSVPDLPEGVETLAEARMQDSEALAEILIAFFTEIADIPRRAPEFQTFPAGVIWIAWPRRAGGHDSDTREQDIRDLAMRSGSLKVPALDEDWSGLRLVWRK